MGSRALWCQLRVVVTDIDPSTPTEHRCWLEARIAATPRKGGVTLHEGAATRTLTSWRYTEALLWARVKLGKACARGIEDTATGRFHLDRAARWWLLYNLLARHRRTLWPAEEDCL